MGLLPNIGYPQAGKEVNAGMYACVNCPHDGPDDKSIAYLPEKAKLPERPVCGHTYWMKVF